MRRRRKLRGVEARCSRRSLLWIALLLAALPRLVRARCTALDAVESARLVADHRCPCDSAASHGTYVRCVASVAANAVRTGHLPEECKAIMVHAAAQSRCG